MPRLRPLHLGTETLPNGIVRDRVVLILDHMPPARPAAYANSVRDLESKSHLLPPVLAFVGNVDLPEAQTETIIEYSERAQKGAILVLGAFSDDAREMATALQGASDATGETIEVATPTNWPTPGLHVSCVVRTEAYNRMPDSAKQPLEDMVRRITTSRPRTPAAGPGTCARR